MLSATYDGYFNFKNTTLSKATERLYKAGKQLVSNYAKIGEILIDIKENELFKDDFNSFGEFTKEVLGISQGTAYGMMSVCTRFLLPETKNKDTEPYFTRFSDTALFSLLPLKMTYDETVEFCEKNDISEITPVSEIKAIVKKAKAEKILAENPDNLAENEDCRESTDTTEDGIKSDHSVTPRDIVIEAVNIIRANPDIYKGVADNENLTAFIQLYNGCLQFFKSALNARK